MDEQRKTPTLPGKIGRRSACTFALVATNGAIANVTALQLVLAGGERLEIPRGIDEATLRTVLALLRNTYYPCLPACGVYVHATAAQGF
jgi:hypothetical protein